MAIIVWILCNIKLNVSPSSTFHSQRLRAFLRHIGSLPGEGWLRASPWGLTVDKCRVAVRSGEPGRNVKQAFLMVSTILIFQKLGAQRVTLSKTLETDLNCVGGLGVGRVPVCFVLSAFFGEAFAHTSPPSTRPMTQNKHLWTGPKGHGDPAVLPGGICREPTVCLLIAALLKTPGQCCFPGVFL